MLKTSLSLQTEPFSAEYQAAFGLAARGVIDAGVLEPVLALSQAVTWPLPLDQHPNLQFLNSGKHKEDGKAELWR